MSENLEKGGQPQVNNFKVITNVGQSDLIIMDIEGQENGLSIPVGVSVDLSTKSSREASGASQQLIAMYNAGNLRIDSRYPGATEADEIDALQAAIDNHEARIAALEART